MLDAGFRIAALALLALVAGLVLAQPALVPVSLVALGALYGAQLVEEDAPLDAAAPFFGAGLLLTAELAYWSLEEREGVRGERGEAFRRVAIVVGFAAASLVVTAVLLVLVDLVRAGGLAINVAGAAAAAAVLLAIVVAARERATEE